MKEKVDIRSHPKQSWKDCAYMYRQLWLSDREKAEKFDIIVNCIKGDEND